MRDKAGDNYVGIFTRDLEEKVITSAPEHCRPTLQKPFVKNILEKLKPGHMQKIKKHFIAMDKPNSPTKKKPTHPFAQQWQDKSKKNSETSLTQPNYYNKQPSVPSWTNCQL